MVNKKEVIVTLIVIVILISSCATYYVYVDSISSNLTQDRKSYVLLPGNKGTPVSDLQFKEYTAYVNRALLSQGFITAKTLDEADVAIFLLYGIGDPQEH